MLRQLEGPAVGKSAGSATPPASASSATRLTRGDEPWHGHGYRAASLSLSAGSSRSGILRAPSVVLAILSLGWIIISAYDRFACLRLYDYLAGTSPLPLDSRHSARVATTSLLTVFQLYPPVLTATPNGVLEIANGPSDATVDIDISGGPTCQQTLVTHSFGNSYGVPFVGTYTPPNSTFNHVTWNLTVTSAGRQFDRLGTVSLGDIEVFRTSTAEPTANGIEWNYIKDMTSFLPLFKREQTIIFDLGNLISSVYTASFNVSLTASFFSANDSTDSANLILPISKLQGAAGLPSYFTVPPDTASTRLTLPKNVRKAIFTVAATGQAEEEFWWSNVPQSQINTFPDYGLLYGHSPFREIQLYIDDMLAGVVWPFPVIFTGGVVPGLWRPIVGIDAFDLKEDEIDITAWLPLLCDGNAHNFTIRVSGIDDAGNGSVTLLEITNGYWYISGKVFVWLDATDHETTGAGPFPPLSPPVLSVTSTIQQSSNGTNLTLLYQVTAHRKHSFQSTINLSTGNETVGLYQSLSYSNIGNYTQGGYVQTNTQQTTGYDVSSSGYARTISYLLYAFSAETFVEDNLTLIAVVNRGKNVYTLGQPVFPTGLESFPDASAVHSQDRPFDSANLSTSQDGAATYIANTTSNTSFSFGIMEQEMTLMGHKVFDPYTAVGLPLILGDEELYHRYVLAVNGTVLKDNETLLDTEVANGPGIPTSDGQDFSFSDVPRRGGYWHSRRRGRRA